MTLSVCLIARDEEDNLPRALASVADVADEIVVTDTGSVDRTVEIARDFGARIHHFPWCDDFSAARNHCIGNASKDWIFWIDADEELLPESIAELRGCLDNTTALGYFVSRQDLVDAKRPDYFTQMWQLRLFRNRPDLRFQGRCHPDFHPPITVIAGSENLGISTSNIVLRHYGYIGDMRRQKLLRAVRLLELELTDRPDQLYYLIEYGRTLTLLNDSRAGDVLARATEQVLAHKEDATAPSPMVAALFEYLIQLPNRLLPGDLKPAEVRDLAIRWFPKGAPLLWIMAQQAFSKEDYEQAETLLQSLVRMGKNQSYDQHISFDPRIVGEDALLNLGVCRVRQAKLRQAEECFQELLQNGLQVKAAEANLKAINRLRKKYQDPGKRKKKSKAARNKRRKRRS